MNKVLCLLTLLAIYFLPANARGKRALLIGISEYPAINMIGMSWDDIHGSNDVALLAPTLKKQGFTITTITNKSATAANIRKAFKKLVASTKKGDLVYIHLSGHGQPVEDLNHDEADGWDEAFVPYDAMKKYKAGMYEGKNHIIDDEINTTLDAIRKKAGSTGFVYLVVDACHAGSISKDDAIEDSVFVRGTHSGFSKSDKVYSPKLDRKDIFKIPSKAGYANVCVLEACRSYENNVEIKMNANYYGPLSYYVNKALQTATLSSNTSWTNSVITQMDSHLQLQHAVIETSLK